MEEKVKEFLESINKKDKIALIFHNDCDGFVSGRMFYDSLKDRCEIKIFPRAIEKDLLKKLDLKDFNKLIVLDLAGTLIGDDLNKLVQKKEILYVDHHPSEIKLSEKIISVIGKSSESAARLSYDMMEDLISVPDWLVLVGMISDAGDKHKENMDFIEKKLNDVGMNLKEFKEKIVFELNYFLAYFEKDLEKAFEIFSELNDLKDIGKIRKYTDEVKKDFEFYKKDFEKNKEDINGIIFYYFEPKFSIKDALINEASYANPDGVYVLVSPRDNYLRISARCQTLKVNVREMLIECCKDLKNSNAGGHTKASGAMIEKNDLGIFKENLKSYMKRISEGNI